MALIMIRHLIILKTVHIWERFFLPNKKVSVNGGEAQKLIAYNRGGFNYIKIRDLARLLNGTSSQFDVEYDETVGKINIVTGKPYTANENDTDEIAEVKTAGQKPPEHIHFVVTVKMCVSEE